MTKLFLVFHERRFARRSNTAESLLVSPSDHRRGQWSWAPSSTPRSQASPLSSSKTPHTSNAAQRRSPELAASFISAPCLRIGMNQGASVLPAAQLTEAHLGGLSAQQARELGEV